MKLSPHFSLSEFTKSQTATRNNIDNSPTTKHLENLKLVCQMVLEPVRVNLAAPIIITSGYRSLELNSLIGGSPMSQHCNGQAADFEVIGFLNGYVANYIKDKLIFDQLILEFYNPKDPSSGWVHVSYRGDGLNRKEVLTAVKENGKTIYKEGIIL